MESHEEQCESSLEESSCNDQFEEKRLPYAVRQFRHKIYLLGENLHQKEEQVHDLRRIKDRLEGEVRRLENTNKNLKKQLTEERKEYAIQKEKFCSDMLNCKRSIARFQAAFSKSKKSERCESSSGLERSSTEQSKSVLHIGIFSEIASLRTENEKLRSIVEKTDEQNYELCVRFFRMKRNKDILWKKLQEVDDDFIQVLKNFMEKFNEVRKEYNMVISESYRSNDSLSNIQCVEMAQTNSNLAYENAYLKLELQCLKRDINAEMYGPRTGKKRRKSKKRPSKSNQIQVEGSRKLGAECVIEASKTTKLSYIGPEATVVSVKNRALKTKKPCRLHSSTLKRVLSTPNLPGI